MHHSGSRWIMCLWISVLPGLVVGCKGFETGIGGSWEHYSRGGMLAIGNPHLTDEGQLFFVSAATGCGDIYRVDMDSLRVIRVTSTDSFEGNPTVSSDGSLLYFSREQDGTSAVYSFDQNSNTERRITEGKYFEEPVAVLNDGRQLLISISKSSFGGHGLTRSFEIVSTGSSKAATRLTGAHVIANRTGSQILSMEGSGIWLLSGDEFEKKTRIPVPFPSIPLALSEDGNYIVLSRQRLDGQWQLDNELYILCRDSGSILKIGEGHCAIIDDGNSSVVFGSGFGNALTCYSIPNEVSTSIPIVKSFKSQFRHTKNGTSFVFASVTDNRAEQYDIFEVSFETLLPKVIYSVSASVTVQR
jgi:hypothetical protein